jgi:hypothetical protein
MLLGTPMKVTPGSEFGRSSWYGMSTTPVRFFNVLSLLRAVINSSTWLIFSEKRWNAALAYKAHSEKEKMINPWWEYQLFKELD